MMALAGVVLAYVAVIDDKHGAMHPANWAAFGFGCLLVILAVVLHIFGHEED